MILIVGVFPVWKKKQTRAEGIFWDICVLCWWRVGLLQNGRYETRSGSAGRARSSGATASRQGTESLILLRYYIHQDIQLKRKQKKIT